jgi:PAS domain-containing protein
MSGAALDLLPIGIGIFDRELRLVYSNRFFGELRDLSPAVCRPGTRLAEIIRYNAIRGDFGPGDVDEQVAVRMAEIALRRPREVEREDRDGRRLLIRYTPVPDAVCS